MKYLILLLIISGCSCGTEIHYKLDLRNQKLACELGQPECQDIDLQFEYKAAGCPKTNIKNNTDLAWDEADKKALITATKNCKKHYPQSPCLKLFSKQNYHTYWAICGN